MSRLLRSITRGSTSSRADREDKASAIPCTGAAAPRGERSGKSNGIPQGATVLAREVRRRSGRSYTAIRSIYRRWAAPDGRPPCAHRCTQPCPMPSFLANREGGQSPSAPSANRRSSLSRWAHFEHRHSSISVAVGFPSAVTVLATREKFSPHFGQTPSDGRLLVIVSLADSAHAATFARSPLQRAHEPRKQARPRPFP